jgi:AcrR family transcriptional regulator
MSDAPLSYEEIVTAAEEVLRRYGPGKATVVDVARALGVSHGTVYRHFPSKAALRDAVMERWLEATMPPLRAVVDSPGPASERLRRWLETVISIKRARAFGDPELFATFLALAEEAREVVQRHVEEMAGQIAAIIADGVASGEFGTADPVQSGWAVLYATARFHNPRHAAEWSDPGIDAMFEGVWNLILNGLKTRSEP